MRIAVAGKGGVGKTTLSALICWALKERGMRVLAVDADPDANLGFVLGFPDTNDIIPIARMKELIEERMGVTSGNRSFFKLNPQIDDIPDKFLKVHDGIKLIVMGTIEAGDSGCVCPENTFLKRLLHQIILRENEHIVVDFEAGVEHLGRGTAAKFDRLLIVVEPNKLSMDTFKRIYPLAKDIGIKQISVVANNVKSDTDIKFINAHLGKVKLSGSLSYCKACVDASQKGDWQVLKKEKIYQEAKEIVLGILNV